ncbi:MAG TPA: cupin domain-containing protein, partial [Aestuariivirga sp.]
PFHNHQVNEEMFYVLAGNGEIRIGENKFAIKSGDIIACPAGGPDTAHQIINTGKAELRYLAVSTKQSPEITEYPDTGRFGILGELAPKKDGSSRIMMFIGDEAKSLEYWDSE